MSSIRLYADQVSRLRDTGNAARALEYAVRRYRRGDFRNTEAPERRNCENVLQILSIRRKPAGLSGAEIRRIVDAHFATPDSALQKALEHRIAAADRLIQYELQRLAAAGPAETEWPETAMEN